MTPTVDDLREATSFCRWFADNRDYLAGISAGLYGYDEDVLSGVFESIYTRILGGEDKGIRPLYQGGHPSEEPYLEKKSIPAPAG